jgi:hypothetical protein
MQRALAGAARGRPHHRAQPRARSRLHPGRPGLHPAPHGGPRLRSGGPVGVWQNEEIDLRADFRKHFENGDTSASVPDFVGVGIMTDGDQTMSESSADFGTFTLSA